MAEELIPDRWVIVKITNPEETFYKVLVGWSGGFLDGDSWRMNSGIADIEIRDESYVFIGESDSRYYCHREGYGMNNIMHSIAAVMLNDAEKLEHSVKFLMEQEFLALLGKR